MAARDKRYRIGMVAACPFPTHQGTQVFIRHLAAALQSAGHSVHLVCYGGSEYEAELPFAVHRSLYVPVGLRSGPHLLRPLSDVALSLRLGQLLTQTTLDVLHVHGLEALAAALIFRPLVKIPLIYHAHNAWSDELPTYFKRTWLQQGVRHLGRLIDRSLPPQADRVIAFDGDHAARLQRQGVLAQNIAVVPPGLDAAELMVPRPETLQRLRQELGAGPFILYAGNPDPYQNLPLLWQAFAKVREALPKASLLLATHHPLSAFDQALEGFTDRRQVRLYRFTHLEELRGLLALADVGVCPRILSTGAPIKVLNYLAAGLPVVACRQGAQHLLEAPESTLVDSTPEALAQGLLSVLHKPVELPKTRGPRRDLSASKNLVKGRLRVPTAVDERLRIAQQVPLYSAVYSQATRSNL